MLRSANYTYRPQMTAAQTPSFSTDMRQAMRGHFIDALVLSIPMFRFLEIEAIGRLFAPDIILICLFPFLFFRQDSRHKARIQSILLLLGILWLFGQLSTDIIRHTPFVDCVRGWAKIIVTIINFSSLYLLLYGNWRRIVLYAAGLAAGGILVFYINPSIYADGNPWKFGVGPSITWFIILIATAVSEKSTAVCISIVAIAAFINLYTGFRSLGGVCFLTIAYIWFQWRWNRKKGELQSASFKKMVASAVAVLAGGLLFMQGYQLLAQKGSLGENALQIYRWQAYGDLGLFVGGRSEILVSGRAIIDSPVIGHGSWAKDYRYSDLLVSLKRNLGYYPGESSEYGLIPTHSHLFGAWVEAGILGAVFWIWVLGLPIRVLAGIHKKIEALPPLVIFFAFLLMWDILFSPFGGERRFITPYYFVVMMSFLPPRRNKKFIRKIKW